MSTRVSKFFINDGDHDLVLTPDEIARSGREYDVKGLDLDGDASLSFEEWSLSPAVEHSARFFSGSFAEWARTNTDKKDYFPVIFDVVLARRSQLLPDEPLPPGWWTVEYEYLAKLNTPLHVMEAALTFFHRQEIDIRWWDLLSMKGNADFFASALPDGRKGEIYDKIRDLGRSWDEIKGSAQVLAEASGQKDAEYHISQLLLHYDQMKDWYEPLKLGKRIEDIKSQPQAVKVLLKHQFDLGALLRSNDRSYTELASLVSDLAHKLQEKGWNQNEIKDWMQRLSQRSARYLSRHMMHVQCRNIAPTVGDTLEFMGLLLEIYPEISRQDLLATELIFDEQRPPADPMRFEKIRRLMNGHPDLKEFIRERAPEEAPGILAYALLFNEQNVEEIKLTVDILKKKGLNHFYRYDFNVANELYNPIERGDRVAFFVVAESDPNGAFNDVFWDMHVALEAGYKIRVVESGDDGEIRKALKALPDRSIHLNLVHGHGEEESVALQAGSDYDAGKSIDQGDSDLMKLWARKLAPGATFHYDSCSTFRGGHAGRNLVNWTSRELSRYGAADGTVSGLPEACNSSLGISEEAKDPGWDIRYHCDLRPYTPRPYGKPPKAGK